MAFNFFSNNILIVYRKILIMTVTWNETRNELTICAKLCRNVAIFCQQYLACLFLMQETLRTFGNSTKFFE